MVLSGSSWSPKLRVAVVGAILAVAVVAFSFLWGSRSFDVDGIVRVKTKEFGFGGPCTVKGLSGQRVEITDINGETVGLGTLGTGEQNEYFCEFPFLVNDVADGSKFYGVRIGQGTVLKFSREEFGSRSQDRSDILIR